MSDLPPLGDGGMDLPYEANPETVHITEEMIVAGGLVVAAATVPVDGHTYPALMFRFMLPEGKFLPAITLVAMPDQLEALIPLVRRSVADSIKAATS